VDGVTWRDYGLDLEVNLEDLHARVHGGAYRARPTRRVFISKPDGRLRPLGVAALEDKILQRAVVEVLNAVYEDGFRPGHSPHDALDALAAGITRKKVKWMLDADIRDFFTGLDQGWLERLLEHRIADRRVLRLIQKWLRAGVIEDGEWAETETGTAQGASVSPLLSNVYLHYVFDLWADQWRRRHARGGVILVRFADDYVAGFEHRDDAERFLADLVGVNDPGLLNGEAKLGPRVGQDRAHAHDRAVDGALRRGHPEDLDDDSADILARKPKDPGEHRDAWPGCPGRLRRIRRRRLRTVPRVAVHPPLELLDTLTQRRQLGNLRQQAHYKLRRGGTARHRDHFCLLRRTSARFPASRRNPAQPHDTP